MQLKGKVAVVTGAAAGIGYAIARSLSEWGAHVVVTDIRNADIAAAKLGKEGVATSAFPLNVIDVTQWGALAAHLVEKHGGVDILVNNAGLYAQLTRAPFEELSNEEWQRVMNINVFSLFIGCKAIVPLMRMKNGGRIINISSTSIFKAPANIMHYATSKAAVSMMTQVMSRELGGENITVNSIAPGFTLSDGVLSRNTPIDAQKKMNNEARSLKRDQMPEDVGGAVRFLASPDASFITGQSIVVDGGIVTS